MYESEVLFQYAFSKRIYGVSPHSHSVGKESHSSGEHQPQRPLECGFIALISPALQTYPALQTGSWS